MWYGPIISSSVFHVFPFINKKFIILKHFFVLYRLDFRTAKEVSIALKENGLVTKHIKDDVLRVSPALTITEPQLRAGIDILVNTINSMPTK